MFIALFTSSANSTQVREQHKSAHDDYWTPARLEKLEFAGPILNDDGTRRGQVLLVNLPDFDQASALIDNDPFVKAGAFDGYTLQRIRMSVRGGRML